MSQIPLIEHIGWDLTRAADAWKKLFTQKMVAAGYPWYADARGRLAPLIGRSGISQNTLAEMAGMTKQAVQQHLDALEAEGIVARRQDPKDARRKYVFFTEKGLASFAAANDVKEEIERDYATVLGTQTFNTLQKALRSLADIE